jgi:hypothetical protein
MGKRKSRPEAALTGSTGGDRFSAMQMASELDAERVKRAAHDLADNGIEPDKAAMEAAARLAKRDPKHPAVTFLTRALNRRDGF